MFFFNESDDDCKKANMRHIQLGNRIDFLYEKINENKFNKDEEKIIKNIISDLNDLDFIIRGIYLIKTGSGFIKTHSNNNKC